MSIHRASTPSSTTGSTAGSPPATLPPPTPLSPNPGMSMPLPTSIDIDNAATAASAQNQGSAGGAAKRKPSRRANTAERRATHNAVERQRRETLNGRFLDLAALLPNLATVRRPSKSAIVNSSIALIHSNRRQRLLAARELRILKLETDAVRRELNEWRDRSGLPRVEEPARAPEFLTLLGLGQGAGGDGEGGDGWWDGEALDEMGEEERKAYELVMGEGQDDDGADGIDAGGADDEEYTRGAAASAAVKNTHVHPGALGAPGTVNLQHILPRGVPPSHPHMQHPVRAPAIASPTNIAFDSHHHLGGAGGHLALHGVGANTLYEQNAHPHFNAAGGLEDPDKVSAWNAQLYSALNVGQGQWAHQLPSVQPQPAQMLFTPPSTAGSGGSVSPHPFASVQAQQQQHAFLSSLQQQQQRMQMGGALSHGHMYTTPEGDDASSVGSGDGGPRSSGSGGSPQPHAGNYELTSGGGHVGYERRPNLTLAVPIGGGVPWSGNPAQQPPQPQAIVSAGGGGGRHYSALMGRMI